YVDDARTDLPVPDILQEQVLVRYPARNRLPAGPLVRRRHPRGGKVETRRHVVIVKIGDGRTGHRGLGHWALPMPPPGSGLLVIRHFANSLCPASGKGAVLGRNALGSAGRLRSSPTCTEIMRPAQKSTAEVQPFAKLRHEGRAVGPHSPKVG